MRVPRRVVNPCSRDDSQPAAALAEGGATGVPGALPRTLQDAARSIAILPGDDLPRSVTKAERRRGEQHGVRHPRSGDDHYRRKQRRFGLTIPKRSNVAPRSLSPSFRSSGPSRGRNRMTQSSSPARRRWAAPPPVPLFSTRTTTAYGSRAWVPRAPLTRRRRACLNRCVAAHRLLRPHQATAARHAASSRPIWPRRIQGFELQGLAMKPCSSPRTVSAPCVTRW